MKNLIIVAAILITANVKANVINKSRNRRIYNYSNTLLGELNQRQNSFSIYSNSFDQERDVFGARFTTNNTTRGVKASIADLDSSFIFRASTGSIESDNEFMKEDSRVNGIDFMGLRKINDKLSLAIGLAYKKEHNNSSTFFNEWEETSYSANNVMYGLGLMYEFTQSHKVGVEFDIANRSLSDSSLSLSRTRARLSYGFSKRDLGFEAGLERKERLQSVFSGDYRTYQLQTIIQKSYQLFDFEISAMRVSNSFESALMITPKATLMISDDSDKSTSSFLSISKRSQTDFASNFGYQKMDVELGIGMQDETGLFEMNFTRYELDESAFRINANFSI